MEKRNIILIFLSISFLIDVITTTIGLHKGIIDMNPIILKLMMLPTWAFFVSMMLMKFIIIIILYLISEEIHEKKKHLIPIKESTYNLLLLVSCFFNIWNILIILIS